MKHNDHIGDEKMIEILHNLGRLQEKIPGGPDLTDGDMKAVHAARAGKDAKSTAAKM